MTTLKQIKEGNIVAGHSTGEEYSARAEKSNTPESHFDAADIHDKLFKRGRTAEIKSYHEKKRDYHIAQGEKLSESIIKENDELELNHETGETFSNFAKKHNTAENHLNAMSIHDQLSQNATDSKTKAYHDKKKDYHMKQALKLSSIREGSVSAALTKPSELAASVASKAKGKIIPFHHAVRTSTGTHHHFGYTDGFGANHYDHTHIGELGQHEIKSKMDEIYQSHSVKEARDEEGGYLHDYALHHQEPKKVVPKIPTHPPVAGPKPIKHVHPSGRTMMVPHGKPAPEGYKPVTEDTEVNEWDWKEELARADAATSSKSGSTEKAIALRKPTVHTGYKAEKPAVKGRVHKGTYGSTYSADDEDHEEKGHKPEGSFDAGALSAALGITSKKPATPSHATPVTTSKIKTGMSHAQQRNTHLQKHAKALGKKASELSPTERREALSTFQAEGVVVRNYTFDDVPFQVIKEGVTYSFEILDENFEVLASGRAPTENGVKVAASRLIESIITGITESSSKERKALDIAKRIAKHNG